VKNVPSNLKDVLHDVFAVQLTFSDGSVSGCSTKQLTRHPCLSVSFAPQDGTAQIRGLVSFVRYRTNSVMMAAAAELVVKVGQKGHLVYLKFCATLISLLERKTKAFSGFSNMHFTKNKLITKNIFC